ncbi:uncharacterized protein LOC123565052 isoform X2 [Mercenaria mercenaria]|uniref:uncharacterized protein LOC123565052 isoform X2 n=1 Tax=Mercenaria mercenaria TaxID=6596 RepID=UPI00234EBD28|nr:uncharacterized protein LOC123565052 isoform X2 [Mercenaria mercenaria]
MYNLFKLVRLLSVKNDVNPVNIDNFAWRQNGESSFIAVSCTNGFLLLRYSCTGCQPLIKQLPWPQDHPIKSLCFDPTITWLLVLTDNGNIFILPALPMLDPSSQVNQLWRVDDVTIITCLKPRGVPTVITWWYTLDGQHIAIVATKLGELLFVDLLQQRLVTNRCVDEHIKTLELVKDDTQTVTHLLITGYSGKQWKMLLEKRGAKLASPDSELSDLGYDHIDGLSLPIVSILNRLGEEEEDIFSPVVLSQFARSVNVSPQYAKGRHLVTAYCTKTSTFQVFDSNLEHHPLFVYRLPVGALHTVLTDRIMFMATKLAGDQKLIVLSNQKAEISEDSDQDFNKEATLQQFELPADEKLISVMQKSFPFYWHEKLEEDQIKLLHDQDEQKLTGSHSSKVLSALEIPLSLHTVLDGCIIVTNSTVYECRPRASPERLFLELCVNQTDCKLVEQLGISLGLDLNFLFEAAADFLLSHGNSKQATRLFHMSKGNPINRISSFSKYGYIQDILPFLQQLLRKENSELSTEDYGKLVELGLHGLVLKLSKEPDNEEIINLFRQFVLEFLENEDLQRTCLRLVTEAGLQAVLLDFAMARGLVIEALEELARQEQYQLSETSLDLLINRGYGGHLAQVASGAFLNLLDPKRLVKIFCERPQLVAQHPDLLLGNLSDLDLSALLQLVEVLDPSKPVIRGFVQRKLHSRRRTSSLTSLTGSGEFGDGATSVRKDLKSVDAVRMVHCFLMVVLHLNNSRALDGEPVNTDFLFENVEDILKNIMECSQSSRQKISCRSNPVGCGQTHAAVALKNGDLYTWGKSNHGRLGHGEQKGSPASCGPCKVGNFHTLQIKVTSVACGMQHTIALTNQGLYGWGSSKYGQVGLGTKHLYMRPMPIEEMSKVMCIAIDCGQYHTVALTDDAQVYSWGWGVHGQLGHGDTEERLVPKLITSFSNQSIIKIATGYCHTLALTLQGELYAFGCGFFGQLGLGTSIKHTLPVKVSAIPEKIITMATKFFHCVAVDNHNHVYQWGSHPHGLRHFVHSQRRARQSGQSNFEQADGHLRPRLVDTTYVNGRIKQVVCGSFHSCIVTKDGDVYTWGRNLDGQLGNGTRQDVRIPQMVTTINDRNIIHLTSGGEYNVAMDIDGQIWVWGRNEFCQLGLQASDARQSNKVIKTAGSKNVSQSLTEVVVPTLLNLLPGSPTSTWQSGSLAESFSISESMESLSFLDEESGTDTHINIPNLAEIGTMPYNRIVIPVILQCVPNLCDCNQLLRNAVDMKDWCVAASISNFLQNYTQAMAFHLMVLRDKSNCKEKKDFASTSLKVIKHYYSLVNKMQSSHEEEYKNFLHQVFYHWEVGKCPVSVLEAFLDSVLDDLSLQLATIIFRKSQQILEEKTDVVKPSLNEPTLAFLDSFTTKFCIKLSSSVLNKLQTDAWRESSAATTLQQLGSTELNSVPVAMLEGDKLPYDQLWQDIMQNLRKGQDGRKYIYVTHSELDRLHEHLSDPDQCQGQVTPAVFFTCGHYYTKIAFTRELERMNKDSSIGNIKLSETLSVIREYYGRKGCLPLACPRCVLSAIMSVS